MPLFDFSLGDLLGFGSPSQPSQSAYSGDPYALMNAPDSGAAANPVSRTEAPASGVSSLSDLFSKANMDKLMSGMKMMQGNPQGGPRFPAPLPLTAATGGQGGSMDPRMLMLLMQILGGKGGIPGTGAASGVVPGVGPLGGL